MEHPSEARPASPAEKERMEQEEVPPKSSESEPIAVVPIEQKITQLPDVHQIQLETVSETSGQHQHVDYFPTDNSEVEDLFDSAGAGAQAHPQLVFEFIETSHDACGDTSDVECTKSELPTVSQPRQLSAEGRTLIRQCFSENPRIVVPMDHLVVAFTGSKVQNMLGALADESVLSSINAM